MMDLYAKIVDLETREELNPKDMLHIGMGAYYGMYAHMAPEDNTVACRFDWHQPDEGEYDHPVALPDLLDVRVRLRLIDRGTVLSWSNCTAIRRDGYGRIRVKVERTGKWLECMLEWEAPCTDATGTRIYENDILYEAGRWYWVCHDTQKHVWCVRTPSGWTERLSEVAARYKVIPVPYENVEQLKVRTQKEDEAYFQTLLRDDPAARQAVSQAIGDIIKLQCGTRVPETKGTK